jgi:hypothetical protein
MGEFTVRLLSALLSTGLKTLQGTSPFGYMPWSWVVRRQGLEPRTRGLRGGFHTIRCSYSPCPNRQVASSVSAETCR